MGVRQDVVKLAEFLVGLTFLLGTPACSGIIRIEPIPTPKPLTTERPQSTVATASVSTTEIPSRIVVETLGLDAQVVEMGWRVAGEGEEAVSVWNVPEREAGWHVNSAKPGQGSNVVISGHNNSQGGHVFGDLEELEVGDIVSLLTNEGTSFDYQISETQIVRTFGASSETLAYLQAVVQPTPTEQLTLITCWPNWTNTHRLILIAHPL